MRRVIAPALVCLLLAGITARAQHRFVPSLDGHGGGFRHSRPLAPPCPPPGVGPYIPGVPAMPGTPGMPPVDPSVPRMNPPVPPPGVQTIEPPPVAPFPNPVVPPVAPQPNPVERRLTDPFAQAREAGGVAARSFNENFDGDFGGTFYKQYVVTNLKTTSRVVGFTPRVVGTTQRVTGFTPVTTTSSQVIFVQDPDTSPGGPLVPRTIVTNTTTNTPIIVNEQVVVNDPIIVNDVVAQKRLARITLAGRYSGVLITDNDSPRPQDRIYGGYNFYDDIGGSFNPGLPQTDLQRQTAGFEKTFLGGDASFGMRLPFVQQYGGGANGTNNVGDVSLLWKYAFYNNRETGDLVSAGLVLTVPTGSGDAILFDGSKAPHSLLFQPWGGFVQTFDRTFVQGITSLVIPTDDRDPTLWNNSVAVGYYLYRGTGDRLLTSVAPVVECHVRTPLTNRNADSIAFFQDQVNVTGGVRFRFGRATLSTSVCLPVAGPRPWALEAISFFNYNF